MATTTSSTSGTTIASTSAKTAPSDEPAPLYFIPIYVLTAIFGAIFIFGPLLVRKGPNRGITRTCIMLTAFCMWIFWTTLYIAQLHPLLGPRLSNGSLAWVGHKWGKNAKYLGKELVEEVEQQ